MTRPAASTTPRLDRCTEPVPEKLRTQVLRELGKLHARIKELAAIVGSSSSSSGAPAGAPYVTTAASGALTAERVLTAGTNITITDNGAGVGTVVIDAASTGAPTAAQYVTLATHASLSEERVLTQGTGITVTDGGANGPVTIATTITQYTDEMAQDAVGGALSNTASVQFTYTDGSNQITANVPAEYVQDTVAALIDTGSGLLDTYNDGAGTLTIGFDEWPPESFYANPTGGDDTPVPVTPGTGLVWNGTELEVDEPNVDGTLVANVASVLHRETAAQDITNTAAATAVLSYNMPAGTLVAGRTLRIRIFATYRNADNGTIRGQTYAFNFGGVTLWTDGPANITGATAFVNRVIVLEFELYAETTTLHYMTGRFSISSANTATTGLGDIQGINGTFTTLAGIDSTVDISSAARLVEVTMQHSAASTNLHWVRRGAYVERI